MVLVEGFFSPLLTDAFCAILPSADTLPSFFGVVVGEQQPLPSAPSTNYFKDERNGGLSSLGDCSKEQ